MDEYTESFLDAYYDDLLAQEKKDKATIKKALSGKSKYFKQALKEELSEFLKITDVTIVKSHEGNKQSQRDDTGVLKYHVNQYVNGGYEGDDYRGWEWIRISHNKYLKFHYEL